MADTVDKKRQDIFYPQPPKVSKPVSIDDSYKFIMSLHKDDYIKITTDDDKQYEGYIVQCNMPVGQFVIRSADNSPVFSIKTNTFEPGDHIVLNGTIYTVLDYHNGNLRVMSKSGIIEEVVAEKKQNRSGQETKKQIKTLDRYEKRDTQKKINIGTFKNLQKFHVGVLGDLFLVRNEKRARVCAIKPQSEKKKGRKQPKGNKDGLANPSINKTM